MAKSEFNKITEIQMSLQLAEHQPLTVDYDGILFIDPPVDAAITNLAWTFPLK